MTHDCFGVDEPVHRFGGFVIFFCFSQPLVHILESDERAHGDVIHVISFNFWPILPWSLIFHQIFDRLHGVLDHRDDLFLLNVVSFGNVRSFFIIEEFLQFCNFLNEIFVHYIIFLIKGLKV